MRRLLLFFALYVLPVAAQTVNGVQCTASVTSTPTLRSEGLTELIGDFVFNCTGGQVLPTGTNLPQTDLTVTLNTDLSSRLLAVDGSTEALLMINDPLPVVSSGSTATAQVLCNNALGCVAKSDGLGGIAAGSPNVFKGTFAKNSITFHKCPRLGAPAGGTFRYRIANVWVNANSLVPNINGTATVAAAISFSDTSISVNKSTLTVGIVAPSLQWKSLATASGESCPTKFGGSIFNPANNTQGLTFSVTLAETGGVHFLPRYPFQDTTDPNASAPLTIPGSTATTPSESGTILPPPSSGPQVGLADSGTPLSFTLFGVGGLAIGVPTLLQTQSNGSNDGGFFLLKGGGSGPTTQFTVPSSSNQFTVTYTIIHRSQFTSAETVTVPFTISGIPPILPLNINMTAGYPNSTTTSMYAWAPGSSEALVVPSFVTDGTGFHNALSGIQRIAATITGCGGSQAPSLSLEGAPQTLELDKAGNFVTPSVYNLNVVSNGTPVTGLTALTSPSAPWLNTSWSQNSTPSTLVLSLNLGSLPSSGGATTVLAITGNGTTPVTEAVTYNSYTGPVILKQGILNVTNYNGGALAPYEVVVGFGENNFGPSALADLTLDSTGKVSTELGNTQLFVNNIASPMWYVFDNLSINAGQFASFIPGETTGASVATVQVASNGTMSPPVDFPVVAAALGLSTAGSSGSGPLAALNQDNSVNSESNPIPDGQVIQLFGTGVTVSSAPADGSIVQSQLSTPIPVIAYVNGAMVTPTFGSFAPDAVAGVMQVNVPIPSGTPAGPATIMIRQGDAISQMGIVFVGPASGT